MLNIGQVVYDYTNNRVIIFAGFEMLQNQKTGKCYSESAFILKDGTFIHFKEKNDRLFKYTNFVMNDKPFPGSFIDKCKCNNHYFGILDGDNLEIKTWAKESIKEMEILINKQGLDVKEEILFGNRKCTRCYIKKK